MKEILEEMKYFKEHYKEFKNVEVCLQYDGEQITLIYDHITSLQKQLHQASLDIQELTEKDIGCPSWCDKLNNLQEENKRLKEIAHKMHLWIFLHSGDEQKVYDELGE